MTGFSPAWLALRETADVAARNGAVLSACARVFDSQESLDICDLGAGTGASVRAFADRLPPIQRWTLVDHDRENLRAAEAALSTWADSAATAGDTLTLRRGSRRLEIRMRVHDLAANPVCWPARTGLVTASAFFDLVSAAWITELTAALHAEKIALLATLTADGGIVCLPPHPLDEKVIAAFCRHQMGDKGFGPAAGPAAARHLEAALEARGYVLTTGDSPWALTHATDALLKELVTGMAGAVTETGAVDAAELTEWLKHRRGEGQRLTIGHRDVFARPG